jgi:DNA-binding NarL/FixJ family response regulator
MVDASRGHVLPADVVAIETRRSLPTGTPISPQNPVEVKSRAARKHIRLLLIGESEADATLVVEQLHSDGMQAVFERVESKQELAATLRAFKPDVVLADYAAPRLGFREALSVVQSIRAHTPVIVVADKLRTEDSGSCVRAGVETVISKANFAHLAAAIDEALEARAPLRRLTTRQTEVMRLVTQGYRTREIAKKLQLSDKTVESHRHQLMQRLGLYTVADVIRYAVRVGMTLASPVSSIAYMLTHGVEATVDAEDATEVADLAG